MHRLLLALLLAATLTGCAEPLNWGGDEAIAAKACEQYQGLSSWRTSSHPISRGAGYTREAHTLYVTCRDRTYIEVAAP